MRAGSGRRTALTLLLLAAMTLPFFYRLGAWPLFDPDEGRNAEVAREMAASGQWAVPRFDGQPYLDKPVLLFWAVAAVFRLRGVGEASARLPSALAALATTALTLASARLLLGPAQGLLAASIVATSPLVLAFARLVIFDMLLTALVTAALYCLLRARLGGAPARWLPAAGAAMGLATLTKGPVGIAVPLLVWLAGRGALPPPARRARAVDVAAAGLVAAAVVVPWLACVLRSEPGFLRYALVDETWLRLTSSARFHRGGPAYYYLETLAWALGPWLVMLLAGTPGLVRRWRAGGADAPAIAFAARGTAAVVVFFTLAASKRPYYLLPIVMLLGILGTAAIAGEAARAAAALRAFARWMVVAGVAGLVVARQGFHIRGGEFFVVTPAVVTAAGAFLVAWGVVTAVAGRAPRAAIVCCALFGPVLGLVLLRPLAAYAEARSPRALAARIGPTADVVCFEAFRPGLPFYLGRPLLLLSDTGRELTSNYVVAEHHRLIGRGALVPSSALGAVLARQPRPWVLTTPWELRRLERLAGLRVTPLYADRRSVLVCLGECPGVADGQPAGAGG